MNASKTEQDVWMEKIAAAVRSVRLANRLSPIHTQAPGVALVVDRRTGAPAVD